MKQSTVIAPSLLSAHYTQLGSEAKAILEAGADWLHVDVMDNHFVPNLSFGAPLCKALRQDGITAPLDVHLMVTDATKLIDDFAKAGATLISIHLEAEHDLRACLQQIRKLDCKAGLVLNPDTLIDAAAPYLADIDMLLIMSVYPGFAAQGFLPSSIERLQEARALIDDSNLPIRLEIDGGIKLENVAAAVSAGADTIVAGSAIFGTNDYPQTISAFQKEIQTADLA